MKGQTFTHTKTGNRYIVTDECEIKNYDLDIWVKGVVYAPMGEHPNASVGKVYVRFIEDFEKKFTRTYPDAYCPHAAGERQHE